VAGERITLTVKEREHLGSAESRRLRRSGWIPGVLYGKGNDPRAIAVLERELRGALTGASGLHAVLDVVLDGQTTTHASILKEYQQDPLRGHISHIDLQEVRLDQPIQAAVSVSLQGEPAGVKAGGVLSQVASTINVQALPLEVPEHIEADISAMEIGDTLRLSDLSAPEGVTFLDDPDETVIATVAAPRVEEEPEPTEEEEAVEGEAPEGAEEPVAEASEGAGEPEAAEE
jgi:large subunit ribosomal protein L25